MFSTLLRVVVFILSLSKALAECKLKGVNIAGFDFGCSSDGNCLSDGTTPPLLSPGKWKNPRINKFKYYADGIGQMQHFAKAHGMNIYRLPVSWQFLINFELGGKLDYNAIGLYNDLVQGCLDTGGYCIIDIHNYARWGGRPKIIGQGGPSNYQFADLWRQLAEKYKNEEKVVFGLMNEPHTVDMEMWSDTIQHVVNSIRRAGANSQLIFLPGTNYTSALDFQKFSAPPLSEVKNPDGSYHNLIYEVHRYYNDDDIKKSSDGGCNTDWIEKAYEPLANYLRAHKRMAFIGEAGGSSAPSCHEHVCNNLAFVNHNSDVFLGFTGWSAGAFFPDYDMALTPSGSAKTGWKDQPLLLNCFAKNFSGGKTKNNPHPAPKSSPHPAPKNNPHPAHKANHQPSHKTNSHPTHNSKHQPSHKNNHPPAHNSKHQPSHKNNHPPAPKKKSHAAVGNAVKWVGKKFSPKKATKKIAHKIDPHSNHKSNAHPGKKSNPHAARF